MGMELSKRLEAVASMVSEGNVAADIGCDHGFVSIWLVRTGRCPKVIAMDVRKGPLSAAEEHIREYGLTGYIETRLSDGMAALGMDEVQTALAAGMGGRLMVRILEEGREKAARMQELVLQPQSEPAMVRRYLREQGFGIAEEKMVLEDGKFYPMFRVLTRAGQEAKKTGCGADGYIRFAQEAEKEQETKGCPENTVEAQQVFDAYGKLLLQKRDPVLLDFLRKEERVCSQIICSIREHAAEGREERLQELADRQRLIRTAFQFYENSGME